MPENSTSLPSCQNPLPFSGPKLRVIITPEEHQLLEPGLDLLTRGLATAMQGFFPHRHPLHRIDFVKSDIYRNQEYSPEMAERLISVRAKLGDTPKSRKLRFDVIDLSTLQFSARLLKLDRSERLDDHTKAAGQELIDKLEIYRRRTKRAAVNQVGQAQYAAVQQRWGNFVAWCRYNLLQFGMPKIGNPILKRRWREQTEQLDAAVVEALTSSHFEPLPPVELKRIVGLLKTSLRRGRQPVTPRQLLNAPEQHRELLVSFVQKRTELTRTPGAPLPYWEAYFQRAEVLAAYQNRFRAPNPVATPLTELVRPLPPNEDTQAQASGATLAAAADSIPSPTSSNTQRRGEEIRKRIQQPTVSQVSVPNTAARPAVSETTVPVQRLTPADSEPNETPIPVAQTVIESVPTPRRPAPVLAAAQPSDRTGDEELYDGLATWFATEVKWRHVPDVVREARSLVERNVHRSYKKPTSATTVPEILKELQPVGAVECGFNVTEPYISTLLGCLLAVRSDPGAMINGIARGVRQGEAD